MRYLDSYPPPCVVVGIDGSRAAVDAALWAVDEAVSRDIPLRLVSAIEPSDRNRVDPATVARDLATAETAVRYAFMAIESTDKPVKIEVEILQDRSPARALLEASESAAMLCIGSIGLKHTTEGRVGDTVAAVVNAAQCPVGIVGGYGVRPSHPGWVVAELDGSIASNAVVQHGIDEALLRGAPLRVLTSWQSRCDPHNRVDLDDQLAAWRRRYPTLDIGSEAIQGSTLTYVAGNAKSIQLVVVGRDRERGVDDLLGPLGHAVLHNADCSFVICESQNGL
jgi:nucleotide-binding universal stress UspA family protein